LLFVACGSGTPRVADDGKTEPPRPARAAQEKIPPNRADGRPWQQSPPLLRSRVLGRVLLAARASEATVRAAECEGPPGGRLLGANVDEFALTATFRHVPRNSANPDLNDSPMVTGCTAKWNREDERWERVHCDHYAPAGRRHAIARSGGGMIGCLDLLDKPRRTRDSPLMIWIEPPPRARWIVVRRSAEYAVAYPVVRGRPVRLVYSQGTALPWADNLATVFPYLVIYASGRTQHLAATGRTAG
jgi:hypothetical protein